MLRARVHGKTIEAVTIGGGVETIRFNSKIFVCGLITIGRLNLLEGVNNWAVRSAGLDHLRNCRSLGAELNLCLRRQLNLIKVFG
jgi:hypothetical protein